MNLLGNIISRSINIRNSLARQRANPEVYQLRTLRKLLEHAQYTAFGKKYDFEAVLLSVDNIEDHFRANVPICSYNEIFAAWWHKLLEGEENVTWPGKVKYFALSSGTSESSSKYIPVTSEMIRSIKSVAMKQFYSMSNFDIPIVTFSKGILMLGGSTSLTERNDYFEGDMSGICAKNIPKLFSNIYYKPGQKISRKPNWEERIQLIVQSAPKWDVGTLAGVPSWAQIVLERIIKEYKLKDIHEIWPNLEVYIHGGISFEPYRDYFTKLLGRPITYIETYMSSEGSFGFEATPDAKGIKLITNTGIFYEFIPFNKTTFDPDGNLIGQPKTLLIHEVQSNVPYAMVISTCAGTWRYIIGDVLEFKDVLQSEIHLIGRTKQFLSICGEHISIENLDHAIEHLVKLLDFKIYDYSVAGCRKDDTFIHHWFIGVNDDSDYDIDQIRTVLDEKLCILNDDYKVERTSALSNIEVSLLPKSLFEGYMKNQGKYGAMNKFPRVLKGEQLKSWYDYLAKNKSDVILSTTDQYNLMDR